MITRTLTQFRQMQDWLLEHIEDCETPEFLALDGKAAVAFEAILRTSPTDAGETRALIFFLLDMIAANGDHDNHRLIERVRELTGLLDTGATAPPGLECLQGGGI